MAINEARVTGLSRPRRGLRQNRYAPYFFVSPFFILFTIFFYSLHYLPLALVFINGRL